MSIGRQRLNGIAPANWGLRLIHAIEFATDHPSSLDDATWATAMGPAGSDPAAGKNSGSLLEPTATMWEDEAWLKGLFGRLF
jgi:hypothetical protein